jgi:hypothetical protein
MSDRIKSNDVIDDELFIKVSQNSESFMKNLTLVEAGLKAILVEAQKVMATTIFANSDNIEKYTKALLDAAKAEKILAEAQVVREKVEGEAQRTAQQRLKTDQEKEKLAQQELKTKTAINKETERGEKIKQRDAKAQAAQNSEYRQATAELNRIALRQMDNSIAGRELSKTAKLVAEAHEELYQKVKKAEEGSNRFHRSVGNYKTGFNGLSACRPDLWQFPTTYRYSLMKYQRPGNQLTNCVQPVKKPPVYFQHLLVVLFPGVLFCPLRSLH